MPGGFLPREDHQELTDEEVEHAVAEADALYTESEASLSGASPQEIEVGCGAGAAASTEKNTTVLFKKFEEEESDDGYDRRTIAARGGETLDSLIKGAGVDAIQAGLAAEAVAKVTNSKKLRSGRGTAAGSHALIRR